jgi:hypothetical protein
MPQTHAHGVGALRHRMRTGKQRAEGVLPAQRPRGHGSAARFWHAQWYSRSRLRPLISEQPVH